MKSPDVHSLFNLYGRMAPRYDLYARLFHLLGIRLMRYRTVAIDALHLRPGCTVVDVGCGTGLNLCLLEETVGPTGKIIGVDLSDAMLEQARMRIAKRGWRNIELVCSDAAEFSFPSNVGGIISTFALTLIPEYDAVIGRGAEALATGARWCVLDFKIPTNWLKRFAPILARILVVPFGGTIEMGERRPWESIQKYLDPVLFRELYFGCAYIAVGQR
jgi:demethylmenaquinone methyltransferase/2-methoxy-6-polyprenyl-1,4-benzoquinol methylase